MRIIQAYILCCVQLTEQHKKNELQVFLDFFRFLFKAV